MFLGRWTSLLRALVPGLAGMARMPYSRFLIFNVVGGVAWATTFVALGYVAGASWRQVERAAGRASLLVLTLVVLVVAIRWVTRRLVARAERVRDRLAAVAATPTVQRVAERFATPIAWARDRVTPGASHGLGWTLSLVVTGAAAWLAGIAVQDLFAREELVLLDRPIAVWIAGRVTPEAVEVAEAVVDALGPPFGVWLVAAVGLAVWRWGDGAAATRVVVAAILTAALAVALATTLPTSVDGTRFPAVPVAWLTAVLVVAVPAVGARHLRGAIRFAGAGVVVLVVAALAELVAGDAALSGVVAGLGVGALVAAGGELTARTVGDRGRPQPGRPAASA